MQITEKMLASLNPYDMLVEKLSGKMRLEEIH